MSTPRMLGNLVVYGIASPRWRGVFYLAAAGRNDIIEKMSADKVVFIS